MTIDRLGNYFPQFNRLSSGDGSIDAEEDKNEYYSFGNDGRCDKDKNKRIDFWEYMEATAPSEVRNLSKQYVEYFAERKVVEENTDKPDSLLMILKNFEQRKAVLQSMDKGLRGRVTEAAFSRVNFWDAESREKALTVLGDIYSITGDKDVRSKIFNTALYYASDENSNVCCAAIKALGTIFNALGPDNDHLRAWIIHTIFSKAEGPGNMEMYGIAIGLLGDIYKSFGPQDKAVKNKIVNCIISQTIESDQGEREERGEVMLPALRALQEIYVSLGREDMKLRTNIVNTAIDKERIHGGVIRDAALELLYCIYSSSKENGLKTKIVDSVSENVSSEGLEFLSKVFNNPDIKDKAIRTKIINVVSSLLENPGSMDRYDVIGPGIVALANICVKLGPSNKALRDKIIEEVLKSSDYESHRNIYLILTPAENNIKDKIFNALFNEEGIEYLAAIYMAEESRNVGAQSNIIKSAFMKMDNGDETAIKLLAHIYMGTSDETLKDRVIHAFIHKAGEEKSQSSSFMEVLLNIYNTLDPKNDRNKIVKKEIIDLLLASSEKNKEGLRSLCDNTRCYELALGILTDVYMSSEEALLKTRIEKILMDDMSALDVFVEYYRGSSLKDAGINNKLLDYAFNAENDPDLRDANEYFNYGEAHYKFNLILEILTTVFQKLGKDDERSKAKVIPYLKNSIKDIGWRVYQEAFKQVGDNGGMDYLLCDHIYELIENIYMSMDDENIKAGVISAIISNIGNKNISRGDKSLNIIRDIFKMFMPEKKEIRSKIINDIIAENKNNRYQYRYSEGLYILGAIFSALNPEDKDLRQEISDYLCSLLKAENSQDKDLSQGAADSLLGIYEELKWPDDKEIKDSIIDAICQKALSGDETAKNNIFRIYDNLRPEEKELRDKIIDSFLSYNDQILGYLYKTLKPSDEALKLRMINHLPSDILGNIYRGLKPEEQNIKQEIINGSNLQIKSTGYDGYDLDYEYLRPEDTEYKIKIIDREWSHYGSVYVSDPHDQGSLSDIYWQIIYSKDKAIKQKYVDMGLSNIEKSFRLSRKEDINLLCDLYNAIDPRDKDKQNKIIRVLFSNIDKEKYGLYSDEDMHKIILEFYRGITGDDQDEFKKKIRAEAFLQLEHSDSNVRINALIFCRSIFADSTGEIKKEILVKVESLFEDSDASIRSEALGFTQSNYADCTEKHKNKIREKIMVLLEDKEEDVREEALRYYQSIYSQCSDIEKNELKKELKTNLDKLKMQSSKEERELLCVTFSGKELFKEYQDNRSIPIFSLCLVPDKLKELESEIASIIAISFDLLQKEKDYRTRMAIGYDLIKSIGVLEGVAKERTCREIFDFILKDKTSEVSMFLRSMLKLNKEYLPPEYMPKLDEMIADILPKTPPYESLLKPGKNTIKIVVCFGNGKTVTEFYDYWHSPVNGILGQRLKLMREKKNEKTFESGITIEGRGMKIVLDAHVGKTWEEYGEIFKNAMIDRETDILVYAGHASGLIATAFGLENEDMNRESKIIMFNACTSIGYYPKIQSLNPNFQFITTRKTAATDDGIPILYAILDTIEQKGTWEDARKMLGSGKGHYRQSEKGNFYLPDDEEYLSRRDSDGDGIPDSTDPVFDFTVSDYILKQPEDFDFHEVVAKQPEKFPKYDVSGLLKSNALIKHFLKDGTELVLGETPGSKIRNKGWFIPEGTNAEFVQIEESYPRGSQLPVIEVKFNVGYAHCANEWLILMAIADIHKYISSRYMLDEKDDKKVVRKEDYSSTLNDKEKKREFCVLANYLATRYAESPDKRDLFVKIWEKAKGKYDLPPVDLNTAINLVTDYIHETITNGKATVDDHKKAEEFFGKYKQ